MVTDLHQRRMTFLFLAVLVILGALWLRLFELERFPPGIHPDEAQQFLRHWRYSAGYGHPMFYEGAPEPFDSMLRGVWGYTAGMSQVTMRYVSTLLNVLACAATIGAAKILFRSHRYRLEMALFAGLILTTIPATVIIGRAIYRANQLIFWTPMALWVLGRLWQAGRLRDAVLLGAVTAFGTMMYLAGPFLGLSMTVTLIVAPIIDRRFWIGWRNLLAYTVTGSLLMLPWLYLFLTIPGWLTSRLQDFSPREWGTQYVFDLTAFVDQFMREVGMFIQPNTYFAPNYNTMTSGFLNPVLVLFLVIGFIGMLTYFLRRRDGRLLAILLVLLAMMIPPSLTTAPEEAIRSVGVFSPLGMITTFGVGLVLVFAGQWKIRLLSRVVYSGLVLLAIGSITYTYSHVSHHYNRFEDTEKDAMYFAILREQVRNIFAIESPVYIPLEYLNFRTVSSYYRPAVTVRPYAGETLPAGEIIALFDSWYGTPLVDQPQGYGLYLPDTEEVVILPPLATGRRQSLETIILEQGEAVIGKYGDWLYTRLSLTEDDQRLASYMLPYTVERDIPLVLFDDNLELLDVLLPDPLQAGAWNRVVLYWRLRDSTAVDYYANLQLWRRTDAIESYGRSFEQHNHIYSDLAPTPTWRAGAVYVQEKFVYVFDALAEGGYQWVVNVFTQPNDAANPAPAPMTVYPPAVPIQHLVAIGRSRVGQPDYVEADDPIVVDVEFDATLRLQHLTLDPPPGAIQARDSLTIRLYWDVITAPLHNAIVYLHIKDTDGRLITQQDREPLPDFPMETWQAGQQIMSTHVIPLPDDQVPSSLSLGMYRFDAAGNIIPLAMSRHGETLGMFETALE